MARYVSYFADKLSNIKMIWIKDIQKYDIIKKRDHN